MVNATSVSAGTLAGGFKRVAWASTKAGHAPTTQIVEATRRACRRWRR
jgi:hypothetical protein